MLLHADVTDVPAESCSCSLRLWSSRSTFLSHAWRGSMHLCIAWPLLNYANGADSRLAVGEFLL